MSLFEHIFLPHESNNHRARMLHPTGLLLILTSFIGLQLLLQPVSQRLPFILGYASQIPPEEIVQLTNVKRQADGLSVLRLDSQLSSAALAKASDMFARDYWAHVSPIGTQPWFFITQSGYSYRYAGENLARDFSDPQSIVNAWINSPTHRENLLSSKYQDIGVAVIDGQLGGQETTLVVQLFGTKLSSAQAVSQTSSFTVLAAAPVDLSPTPAPVVSPVPITTSTPVPLTNPFSVSKAISIVILPIIFVVPSMGSVIVARRRIARWTSKSFAHLIFLGTLFIAALFMLRGQIL